MLQGAGTIAYVQGNAATPQTPQTTVSVTFTAAQKAGDLNVVAVGWNDGSATVTSVSDGSGNAYTRAVGPTVIAGVASQSIYFAKNIVAATAGTNIVTVTFASAAKFPDIRILEYSGADLVNPVDVTAGSTGNSTTSSSGTVTTSNPTDLLFAANLVLTRTTGPGANFTTRLLTQPDGDIAEDRMVTAVGSYSATAPVSPAGQWIMQMVAFRTPSGVPDTQSPTAPTNLTAGVSGNQINLSWTASTDNVGVTGYMVERCQGAGCSNFAQIAVPTTTAFTDAGLAAATSFSYRVRATDAAGNLSGYSNTASATTAAPDTQAPTAPGSLTAAGASSSQINLGWTASTDNVGVTGYLVERCQGAGCSGFAQIATPTTTAFSDTGLTAGASYSYRVRATDAAGNLSGYSNTASGSTLVSSGTISYVQGNYATPQSSPTTVNVTFTAAQVAGDLNVVVAGWNDSTATVSGVTDSRGNTYALAVGPTTSAGAATQSIYFARNIVSAGAGANTVTVTFSRAAAFPDIRVLEYSGADPVNPVDVTAGSTGSSTNSSSVAVTTTNPTDLLFGANLVLTHTTGPGAGFTSRLLTEPDGDIAEDRMVTATGSYSASAPVSPAGKWIMQMVAFRTGSAVPDTQPPTAPANLTAVAVSSSQINLSWTASTDNVAVTGYRVERCQGSGCANFAQIAAPQATTFNDTGLTAGAAYNYRVRATDAAGNLSGYSSVASATTQSPDTQPPTAPANLSAAAASVSQINLSWTASTDNVGVTGYLIERCQSAGCSTFAQVGTSAATAYSDTGLATGTSYSYRVRATDAAGNLGPYSNTASATTTAADTTPPTAPGTLTATAASGVEIDIVWGAATDDVGVTGYRVERCQGAGCTIFTKLGTTIVGTTFNDIGLTVNTSYSYIVRAQDAAGNLGPYTNVATATTLATNPQLVTAYSFNEGSGTTVIDLSGTGNTGTISNATWTGAGKYGSGLMFNGTNSLITIADSASLHLTTGFTLEAWVNPTTVSSAWRDVIYKGNDNYYLEATTTAGGVPAIGQLVGTTHGETYGLTTLPLNTWTHLAATYDGALQRLYVNGTEVANHAQTGTIVTSANPLQIGGDSIFGQYFAGMIDEVRVYNVALKPTDIQADMATPLGSTTLPIVTLSNSSIDFGNQAVGTTSGASVVTLTNVGGATLNITSIAVTGSESADFAQTNTCGASLAINASCTISVTFHPSVAAFRSASITITDNAPGTPHTISLTGTGSGFSINPHTAVLTPAQTQQFTVTGPGSGSVTWSVDSVAGGSSTLGTITTSGLYTPPSSVGTHTVTVTTTDGLTSSSATVFITTNPGLLTHHNDNFRTGQNILETVLTPANVNKTKFGKLFSYATDGISHASPLYLVNVNIPGVGLRNVVYVSTEHDSVYAFDADGLSVAALWHVSFINPAAGVTTVTSGDVGECCDITPEIGITGTPVIDASTGTLYVVAKTKENGSFVQRLHALDVTTGAEKFGGPVVIQASVTGNGVGAAGGRVPFDSLRENERTALLLLNGVVYFGYGSHGDNEPYHGWLLGYNATTLQQVLAYNSTPNGEGGGIWHSGGGLVVDPAGNIYFVTGDGTFDANTAGSDYGDSFVKFNAGSVRDYFTPHDQDTINTNNLDLGAGGLVLLPDQPGAHPHLLVGAGKNGTIYLVDRDNLGGYSASGNTNVQTLANIFPFGTPLPGNYSSPVYFNGTVYFGPVADTVQAFRLSNGLLSTSPTSRTSVSYAYPGGALAISANGASNGILWAVERINSAPGVLHAYDASNLATELYNSGQSGSRDALDTAAKFSIPIVMNGKVLVASEGRLTVFGLLP